MFAWQKIPLIRGFLPFMAGITCVVLFQVSTVLLSILLSVSALLIVLYLSNANKLKRSSLLAAILYILLIFSGLLAGFAARQADHPLHFSKLAGTKDILAVKITDGPVQKKNSAYIAARVFAFTHNDTCHKCLGKVVIYLADSEQLLHLKYGDVLFVKNKFRELKSPPNPGEFNFRKYLSNKQVYHQAFLRENEWWFSEINKAGKISFFILYLRNWITAAFRDYFPGQDEFGIMNSLILGQRGDISPEMMNSFVSTGTIHVLSVSGLHVGIIYMVFYFVLFPLKSFRAGKGMITILLLLLLWLYAALTGLIPSVARASLMLTVVIVGNHFSRISNIYSSLIVSALILILINPFVINDLGFQLSYAAVFGIVFLQPVLKRLLLFKNNIIAKIWALAAVTIAAQIFAFPLSVHYFNQFPVYFLLANLVVVPISTVIIYLAFVVLVLKAVGLAFLALYAAKAAEIVLVTMEKILSVMGNLPLALAENLYISTPGIICVYAFLILTVLFIIYRSKKLLFASLISLVVVFTESLVLRTIAYKENSMVIYHIKDNTLVSFRTNGRMVLYGDSQVVYDPVVFRNVIYRESCKRKIKPPDITRLKLSDSFCGEGIFIKNGLLQFRDTRLLLASQQNAALIYNDVVCKTVDYIILHDMKWIDFNVLKSKDIQARFIIDQSSVEKKTRYWESAFLKNGIGFFNTAKTGAVEINNL